MGDEAGCGQASCQRSIVKPRRCVVCRVCANVRAPAANHCGADAGRCRIVQRRQAGKRKLVCVKRRKFSRYAGRRSWNRSCRRPNRLDAPPTQAIQVLVISFESFFRPQQGAEQVFDRKRSRFIVWLTLLALICAPCTAAARHDEETGDAGAAASLVRADKLAADLRALLQAKPANERVKVIVQFKVMSASQAESLLDDLDATVSRSFARLNMRVLTLPAHAVTALAARAAVAYVAPDRPAAAFGHVTNTTGTELIRTQTTFNLLGIATTKTLDGT